MKNPFSNKYILIVANTMLFPARRNGVSVRYYPFVNELIQRGYIIDLIIINKFHEQYNEDTLHQAQQIYRSIKVINSLNIKTHPFNRLIKKITNAARLLSPTGIPYCLIDNNKRFYLSELTTLLSNKERYNYSIGVEVGGGNAILLNELSPEIKPHNIVCDFIDSAYLLRKRSIRTVFTRISPITLLEDIKTKRWEKNISNKLTSIYISNQDAIATDSNATVLPNCVVDDDYLTAAPIQLESPNIGFFGNMGYPPNIEACDFLCDEILPELIKKIPNIQLFIIGRDPSESLLKQNRHPNIHVTGGVDNIWCYVKSIDVFLFPMRSGAGLQNKVLEAMYAGKPVVCSNIANEGIEAMHERDLHLASTIADYVKYTEKSLLHSNVIGTHAKKFTNNNFSLTKCVDNLELTMKGLQPHVH